MTQAEYSANSNNHQQELSTLFPDPPISAYNIHVHVYATIKHGAAEQINREPS